MQPPTPGRTVFYHFYDLSTEDIVYRPAVITSVQENRVVSLHVFFEPQDQDDHNPPSSSTVVAFGQFRSNVQPAAEEPAAKMSGTWSWPPRV